MPVIKSPYKAKALFKNGHFATIYSAKLRPFPFLEQKRQRLELKDGDFIDIDWSLAKVSEEKTTKLAILLHGLEGNAQRTYIKGQGKILVENGWDVAAMNHRGCSGEENRLYLSYNSGRTEDLDELIQHILANHKYDEIALIGFSLGGNVILKYLGEREDAPKEIKSAVGVSVPLYLRGALEQLIKPENVVYSQTFINDLRKKYKRKMPYFPDAMNAEELKQIKNLLEFDNRYTAKAHGFKDAYDYYEKSSALQYLPNIKIPILILNAENDSFLSSECYPFEIAKRHKNIYLEVPNTGGHVGFHQSNKVYYSEKRAFSFITKHE
ncbi:alpha/beta hydrolase [Patiriisocius marinistellae]|uniref:Alpha/beta hydrolase n=1 Tax=Patiriisocius marinistellae TaxID=2494560 RepID=A0A5J4FV15_9FLAO|nr:alpha/beta fold hydrolase [Patiriisocius marinistellae]GEQ85028.1 alpha/beta hydrolase [Patiriisocius marinistellae]